MLVGVRLYVRSHHQGSIIEQQLLTNDRDYLELSHMKMENFQRSCRDRMRKSLNRTTSLVAFTPDVRRAYTGLRPVPLFTFENLKGIFEKLSR